MYKVKDATNTTRKEAGTSVRGDDVELGTSVALVKKTKDKKTKDKKKRRKKTI